MDKYTIDLDQVLNDFEYLELTDQHSKNAADQPHNSNTPSPVVTKHSINNVFHSLNEYLNTSINKEGEVKCEEGTFKNEDHGSDNNGVKESALLNRQNDTDLVDDTEPKHQQLIENIEDIHKLPNCNDNKISTIDKDNIQKYDNSEENLHSLAESGSETHKKLMKTDEHCLLPNEQYVISVKQETNDNDVNKSNSDKIQDNSVKSVADVEKVKDTNQLLTEIGETNSNEEYMIEPVSLNEQNGDCANEECEKMLDSYNIKATADDSKVSLTINNNNSIVSSKVHNLKTELGTVNMDLPSKNADIIGFSDINIDENELTEMLENFEQEVLDNQPSSLSEELKNNERVMNDSIIDVDIIEDTMVQDNAEDDLEVETSKETNQIKENVTTNLEHVELDQEMEIIDKEENKNEKLEHGIVADCDELLEKDQDSLPRPQNLPLKNDNENTNQVGRKIDLIGSPGSTPYNNVYINQSIQPKTCDDSDSESGSSSPTFSDCSGESSTTASTVSIDDGKNVDPQDNKSNCNTVDVELKSDTTPKTDEASRNNKSATEDLVGGNNSSLIGEENTENTSQLPIENPGAHITNEAAGDSTDSFSDKSWLGKQAPLWIPDSDAVACLHCDMKFTVLKRRHHCRACGLVLCSKCCNLKFKLDYMNADARVCNKCFEILNRDTNSTSSSDHNTPLSGNSPSFRPNPNNPLEYCSTVSPLQQVGQTGNNPPTVMVPVGVLKRKGSNKKSNKSVMFCDGIAPGSDLTNLDQDFNYNPDIKSDKPLDETVKKDEKIQSIVPGIKISRNQPKIDQETGCYIPVSETKLPPTISINKTDVLYSECSNSPSVVEMLKNETLTFAINQNLFVHVKIINMDCCINKYAWCFSTEGLINVGSDEVIYLLEYIDEESFVPKDLFFHIHNVYIDAVKGTSVKELGISLHNKSVFLDSRNHAGFVYIKPTFQCLDKIIKPKESYLIGILIHRWETPWAKLFPLRLILRLGAEYRYYPSPIVSTRYRDSVFVEIGHTIINLLADFRNFTFTLPEIKGLIIHMEEKNTTLIIPKNRYDQVIKSINNSSEHILAFAGNFSPEADSHLVCIQNTQDIENVYTTHAINIHNKPRKLTGASFIVFNGSLKSATGLTAKSNIVEDGLMIQIPSEHLEKLREDLRNMKNHTISCGCVNAISDETVNIIWGESETNFNVGVKSPVDQNDMKGVPSIRVHNGKDYFCNNGTKLIRWTEVFILKNGEENSRNQDPLDVSKVSESIAKACCNALVKYLDLLVSNSCQKIGIRATLHVENVSYSAGANGNKLPPIYMKSLDNELIPVLHRITTNSLGDNIVVLELIFRILNS
ncbi:smad anchor for receptor activation isoform X2 [Rhynchophorus ferrugineus]|uniref:FYVE-type domain-containing protein n=1 Tax=Rhynchophorus ferrugineus TaxID=354439 RepID=A0A834IRH7_RHYFE|nr:hypothetical protein GWI33_023265 [Rhynchophorus ferrugineus]